MRKIAIALLATTVLGTPAIAASGHQQQPQSKQSQSQGQNQAQPSGSSQQNAQNDQNQNQQNRKQQNQAQNNQISPRNLRSGEIRQVQQTLDKDGFKAGPTDGRWGPKTASAVKQFQQSKQIRGNGQLNQETLADLGLDQPQSSQSQGHSK